LGTVASPNVGRQANTLLSVATAGDNDVWAIGASFKSRLFAYRTVIEHWNGTAWSVVRCPNATNGYNLLNGVAVVAANDVWTVGQAAKGNTYNTLVEHWNGAARSVVPSPNVAGNSSVLQAISVVSASDIWALGYSTDSNFNNHALALHWNGSLWSIISTPTVNGDILFAADGIASNDVLRSVARNTLTLHWNGSVWSVVPSPNGGLETDNGLSAVAAIAANDVWAVGSFISEAVGAESRTLTLHWNGSAWSLVPSANSGANGNLLHGIAAVNANDIWAAGRVENVFTLALYWNGANWSVVSTPAIAGSGFTDLRGAVAPSSDGVWTAGSFFQTTFNRDRTLTEFWNGSAWSTLCRPPRLGLLTICDERERQ
jgi:hypothetical protein